MFPPLPLLVKVLLSATAFPQDENLDFVGGNLNVDDDGLKASEAASPGDAQTGAPGSFKCLNFNEWWGSVGLTI